MESTTIYEDNGVCIGSQSLYSQNGLFTKSF